MTEMVQKRQRVSYIYILLVFLLLLSAYFIFAPIVKFLFPPAKIIEEAGRKIYVADIDEIQTGRAKRVLFHNKPVLVIRTESSFSAVSGICQRTGCYLNWDYARQQIICPCDYSAYDFNGGILRGPDTVPLNRYMVEIVGDRIYLSEF